MGLHVLLQILIITGRTARRAALPVLFLLAHCLVFHPDQSEI